MNRLMMLALAAIALAGCGRPAEKITADALNPDDADKRREGIVALSSHSWGLRGQYLEAYAALAQDPEPSVRSAAVTALGRAGQDKYAPVLVKSLSDSDQRVRADAADALDKLRCPEAFEPLCKHAGNDPDAMVRARCAAALRHYKQKQALATLVDCLNDDDFGVRRAARQSLRELTSQDVGYDADGWARLLAGKADPFAGRAESNQRWWPWGS